MLNIYLRKFKEKDIKSIGMCIKHKIIPVTCAFSVTPKSLIEDYIKRDMNLEPALAIVNGETDVMLGAIDSISIDDMLLTSYYVLPEYQNIGVCTKALGMFIEYIRKNNPDVRQIKLCINLLNYASQKVAYKSGFKIVNKNEFAEDWRYKLWCWKEEGLELSPLHIKNNTKIE